MYDSPDCRHCAKSADPYDGRTAAAAPSAPFPMPVPLLMQLTRPLNTMEDIESLAAQLNCAQARGCF